MIDYHQSHLMILVFYIASIGTRERSSGLELVVFLHFFICFYKLYWKWYFYITCVLFLPVHASSVLYEALLHTFDKLLASWKQETELFKRDPAHHKITKQLGKLPYSILPRA
ncbi:hypothetical protein ACJX0J_000416, partial (mitochondrion) [Zea mays]